MTCCNSLAPARLTPAGPSSRRPSRSFPASGMSSITYTLRVCAPRSWNCINFIHFQDTLSRRFSLKQFYSQKFTGFGFGSCNPGASADGLLGATGSARRTSGSFFSGEGLLVVSLFIFLKLFPTGIAF